MPLIGGSNERNQHPDKKILPINITIYFMFHPYLKVILDSHTKVLISYSQAKYIESGMECPYAF